MNMMFSSSQSVISMIVDSMFIHYIGYYGGGGGGCNSGSCSETSAGGGEYESNGRLLMCRYAVHSCQ